MNPEDNKPEDFNDVAEQAFDSNAEEQAETTDTADAEEVSVQDLMAQREAAEADHQDQILRMKADMDNQRRRYEKQVEDAHKYSVQKFAESLLPVVDSLEMGLQAEGDLDSIRQGMDLTLKQFASVMEKFKLEAVGVEGEVFDPAKHQAVAQQPSPDHENNTIMNVMQKGYTLSGRTIRPAMVMVCKN